MDKKRPSIARPFYFIVERIISYRNAPNVYELENETGNVALILGSEGKGLRRLTREQVDHLIKIPINDESNSLNVSNAASVAMFQLQKNIIKN